MFSQAKGQVWRLDILRPRQRFLSCERMEADKRATALEDAAAALDETGNALTALDRSDKSAALTALERATGDPTRGGARL